MSKGNDGQKTKTEFRITIAVMDTKYASAALRRMRSKTTTPQKVLQLNRNVPALSFDDFLVF